MNILITGATGFIAKNLINNFTKSHYKIFICSRNIKKNIKLP